jgi:hypothetical protein
VSEYTVKQEVFLRTDYETARRIAKQHRGCTIVHSDLFHQIWPTQVLDVSVSDVAPDSESGRVSDQPYIFCGYPTSRKAHVAHPACSMTVCGYWLGFSARTSRLPVNHGREICRRCAPYAGRVEAAGSERSAA